MGNINYLFVFSIALALYVFYLWATKVDGSWLKFRLGALAWGMFFILFLTYTHIDLYPTSRFNELSIKREVCYSFCITQLLFFYKVFIR